MNRKIQMSHLNRNFSSMLLIAWRDLFIIIISLLDAYNSDLIYLSLRNLTFHYNEINSVR